MTSRRAAARLLGRLRRRTHTLASSADPVSGVGLHSGRAASVRLRPAAVDEGGPVLSDALAYLDCRVEKRMEGPDHWLIYALVEQGNVADLDGRTAVHHRKTGNHY